MGIYGKDVGHRSRLDNQLMTCGRHLMPVLLVHCVTILMVGILKFSPVCYLHKYCYQGIVPISMTKVSNYGTASDEHIREWKFHIHVGLSESH